MLGPWNGYTYWEGATWSGMISFTLLPGNLDNEFQASARSNGCDFKISGKCNPGETLEKIRVSFKRTFSARNLPQYWMGELDCATDTITGAVNFDEDKQADTTSPVTFILKRTPPEHLRFRPPPATFEANKARAFWTFAISATRDYVCQQSWSWTFFRERRDTRIRFIHLYIRSQPSGKPLNEAEQTELNQICKGLTAADNRFYHSLAHHQIRITPDHGKVDRLISSSFKTDNICL
jgi:Vacuolar sorting-associated protein 13, extended-chorein